GLRETEDEVESIGIARTWAEIERADVVIHLQDAREANDELESEIARRLPARAPVLKVFNKIDLVEGSVATSQESDGEKLRISAKTGVGLDALRRRLLDIAGWSPGAQSPWLARERHLQALEGARQHLSTARGHAELDDQVLDLFAEELRLAHEALSAITGQFT